MNAALSQRRAVPVKPFALWNLGFRPFFLFAGFFSAASILAWTAQLAFGAHAPAYVAGPAWHAHEMIFGYAFAVVVGFLFTAVRNWTNQPTPTGAPLALLVLLWSLGRVLMLTPWFAQAPLADAVFSLAAAGAIARPLMRGGNRHNYFFIVVLGGFAAANGLFYGAVTGAISWPPERGLHMGLDLVLFLMAIVGGRVIPMFTANGAPGSRPQRRPWVERCALGSLLALLAVELLALPLLLLSATAATAALANLARLLLWQPWRTFRHPMVWILHAAYGWIVLYLALLAPAAAGLIPSSPALHALTVGAIGSLTLGMMTRVSRGHTGHPLRAGTLEIAAYLLLQCAALVRVGLPLLAPALARQAFVVSGVLWAMAFLAFTVRFAPMLARPRIDGKAG